MILSSPRYYMRILRLTNDKVMLPEKSHVVVDIENGGSRRSVLRGVDGDYSEASGDKSDEESTRSPGDSVTEIAGLSEKERRSSESESSMKVDLESGVAEIKLHYAKVKRDCRICHLSMDATDHESGIPIELGCSCKDDLAAAHKQCAEAWFKIKGNITCEICGSIAHNVAGANETETAELSEANDAAVATQNAHAQHAESQSFWQSHRFLNFLLACMVFAFVISWLFHFNVPS